MNVYKRREAESRYLLAIFGVLFLFVASCLCIYFLFKGIPSSFLLSTFVSASYPLFAPVETVPICSAFW